MRALLPLLLLGACQSVPDEDLNVAGECAVTPSVQGLVGEKATDTLIADARRFSRAKVVRRIDPGTAVTMDYRVDRVNVHVDGRGIVTKVNCG